MGKAFSKRSSQPWERRRRLAIQYWSFLISLSLWCASIFLFSGAAFYFISQNSIFTFKVFRFKWKSNCGIFFSGSPTLIWRYRKETAQRLQNFFTLVIWFASVFVTSFLISDSRFNLEQVCKVLIQLHLSKNTCLFDLFTDLMFI